MGPRSAMCKELFGRTTTTPHSYSNGRALPLHLERRISACGSETGIALGVFTNTTKKFSRLRYLILHATAGNTNEACRVGNEEQYRRPWSPTLDVEMCPQPGPTQPPASVAFLGKGYHHFTHPRLPLNAYSMDRSTILLFPASIFDY